MSNSYNQDTLHHETSLTSCLANHAVSKTSPGTMPQTDKSLDAGAQPAVVEEDHYSGMDRVGSEYNPLESWLDQLISTPSAFQPVMSKQAISAEISRVHSFYDKIESWLTTSSPINDTHKLSYALLYKTHVRPWIDAITFTSNVIRTDPTDKPPQKKTEDQLRLATRSLPDILRVPTINDARFLDSLRTANLELDLPTFISTVIKDQLVQNQRDEFWRIGTEDAATHQWTNANLWIASQPEIANAVLKRLIPLKKHLESADCDVQRTSEKVLAFARHGGPSEWNKQKSDISEDDKRAIQDITDVWTAAHGILASLRIQEVDPEFWVEQSRRPAE